MRWYEIHKSMAATVPNFRQGQEEIRPESKVVFTMMRQWTIEESRHHWESKKRPAIVQVMPRAPPPSLPSKSAILPCLTPKPFQTSKAVSSTVSAPVSSVSTVPTSTSSSVLASPLVSKSTAPSLNSSEMSILDEFLILKDSSEFDLENVPPKTTREIGVKTSPWKDEVKELRAIIERQERVLQNNTLATNHIGELIKHQQPMKNFKDQSIHDGPGLWEIPKVSSGGSLHHTQR